jgi:hypothetical protein
MFAFQRPPDAGQTPAHTTVGPSTQRALQGRREVTQATGATSPESGDDTSPTHWRQFPVTTTNPPAARAGSYRVGELDLKRIGYGAMQLAGPGVLGPPRDRAAAVDVLRTAVELGVNHIDTADAYGPYITNEIIREAEQHIAYVCRIPARRLLAGTVGSAVIGCQAARRDPHSGRLVLAAAALAEHNADPGHLVGRSPAREHRRRRLGPAGRRHGRAGPDLSSGRRAFITPVPAHTAGS